LDARWEAMSKRVEIPYGLQISDDCHFLEENETEIRTMMTMLEGIVEDRPFSEIAAGLNERGFRMRGGQRWNQTAVFRMLPRLVDYSPELFARPDWVGRKKILRVA
jgi:hypothetical protein